MLVAQFTPSRLVQDSGFETNPEIRADWVLWGRRRARPRRGRNRARVSRRRKTRRVLLGVAILLLGGALAGSAQAQQTTPTPPTKSATPQDLAKSVHNP